MTKLEEQLKKLKEPFEADKIEWRVQRSGNKADGAWAMVLAYVTNRAIMDRLDEVFGLGGWQSEINIHDKGVTCKLSVQAGEEEIAGSPIQHWITREDGAEFTDIESFKGGISGAMKRAAVHLGIGRYLYDLEATFVNVQKEKPKDMKGWHSINDAKTGVSGYWQDPKLPHWALPSKPLGR